MSGLASHVVHLFSQLWVLLLRDEERKNGSQRGAQVRQVHDGYLSLTDKEFLFRTEQQKSKPDVPGLYLAGPLVLGSLDIKKQQKKIPFSSF